MLPLLLTLVACGGGSGAADGAVGGSGGDTGGGGGGTPPPAAPSDTYDVDALGIPKFVGVDYIDLAQIYRVARFRSGIGHDYADAFEFCRSMKHYYQPKGTVDWSTVAVYAPVSGTVDMVFAEWAGTQVHIKSQDYPAFVFVLFHVNLGTPLTVGDNVVAGQTLGTHVGSQTMSDIAVRVNSPSGMKLVPFISTLTDSLFLAYQARGVSARNDLIITKGARDADPLNCTGETFGTSGTLENWVTLN
jgi:hypothetical protein